MDIPTEQQQEQQQLHTTQQQQLTSTTANSSNSTTNDGANGLHQKSSCFDPLSLATVDDRTAVAAAGGSPGAAGESQTDSLVDEKTTTSGAATLQSPDILTISRSQALNSDVETVKRQAAATAPATTTTAQTTGVGFAADHSQQETLSRFVVPVEISLAVTAFTSAYEEWQNLLAQEQKQLQQQQQQQPTSSSNQEETTSFYNRDDLNDDGSTTKKSSSKKKSKKEKKRDKKKEKKKEKTSSSSSSSSSLIRRSHFRRFLGAAAVTLEHAKACLKASSRRENFEESVQWAHLANKAHWFMQTFKKKLSNCAKLIEDFEDNTNDGKMNTTETEDKGSAKQKKQQQQDTEKVPSFSLAQTGNDDWNNSIVLTRKERIDIETVRLQKKVKWEKTNLYEQLVRQEEEGVPIIKSSSISATTTKEKLSIDISAGAAAEAAAVIKSKTADLIISGVGNGDDDPLLDEDGNVLEQPGPPMCTLSEIYETMRQKAIQSSKWSSKKKIDGKLALERARPLPKELKSIWDNIWVSRVSPADYAVRGKNFRSSLTVGQVGLRCGYCTPHILPITINSHKNNSALVVPRSVLKMSNQCLGQMRSHHWRKNACQYIPDNIFDLWHGQALEPMKYLHGFLKMYGFQDYKYRNGDGVCINDNNNHRKNATTEE